MLTLDLVTFDTRDFRAHTYEPRVRSWNVSGDVLRFELVPQPCPEISVEGWRARAEHETAAHGGTWISFDEVCLDSCRGFRGIFKFPAAKLGFPPDSLAVYIVGLIAVPLGDGHLTLHAEAVEKGTTGLRESAFAIRQPAPSGPPFASTQPAPSGSPPQVVSMEHYFDRVRLSLGKRLPSDAPEVDALVPLHPLSRVRAYQQLLLAEVRLAPALKGLALPPSSERPM